MLLFAGDAGAAGRGVIVASVSGGKDSTAMALHLREQGLPYTAVFLDTGWEHELTYEYLSYLDTVIGPITRVKAQRTMVELIRFKRMFPGRLKRYCTEELKVFPMRDYIAGLDSDAVNAVGIRAQESAERAKNPPREWSDVLDCEVWRPILDWTLEDVVAIHRRHDVKPNPLYLKGARRVGCWPCIFSRKSEVRMVAETDPARIDLIELLEAELTEKVGAQRTFFAWKDKKHADPRAPIREFVDWSKTAYGGTDYEDYDADAKAREGCMRWGLCSTEPEASS